MSSQRYYTHRITCRSFISEFEADVQADSCASLTKLNSAMHARLPTELRSMIYAYLLPTEDSASFWLPEYDPYFDDPDLEDSVTTKRSFDAGTQDTDKPGAWLNPAYVGKNMARDLAEIYYSSRSFSLDMRNMSQFLHEDRTDSGFKPMEHLRKGLTIRVMTTMTYAENGWVWSSIENEQDVFDRIYTTLKDLLLLSHLPKMPVTICICTCSVASESEVESVRRFYNIMEAVREPIYDLLHAGVDLKIWDEPLFSCVANNDSQMTQEGSLNQFAMGKDEWHKERQSHGTSWVPSSNFVTREDCQEDMLRQLLEQRWGQPKNCAWVMGVMGAEGSFPWHVV